MNITWKFGPAKARTPGNYVVAWFADDVEICSSTVHVEGTEIGIQAALACEAENLRIANQDLFPAEEVEPMVMEDMVNESN